MRWRVVTAVLLLLLLTASNRIEHLQQIPRVYIYRLPVIGLNMNLSTPIPNPPVRNPMAYGVVDMNGKCDTLELIGARWTYNYSTSPLICPNIESMPMIQAPSSISNTLGGNSPWLLGFNEPEMAGFAHQTADEGAQNWRLIEAKTDKLLVSPSVISGGTYDALNWLHDFRVAYFNRYGVNPRLDALGVHIYFEYAANAEPVISQAIALAKEWGARGVMITEMGMAHGDPTGNEEKAFLDWIQAQPQVLRYAWFGSDIDVQQGIQQGWYSADWVDMSLAHGSILTPFGEIYTAVMP